MSEAGIHDLNGVAETMLITLYVRAKEIEHPDPILRDERAAALVRQMPRLFERVSRMKFSEVDQASLLLRSREFDRAARDFLARWPEATVVHIGCGLDTRFERVDNGRVEWFDLDLPEVIGVRKRLVGNEGPRHRLLAGSVFDEAWLDQVSELRRPVLFLAEGVSLYCREDEWRRLCLRFRDRFPGSEFVFDAFSPLHVWLTNLQRHALRLAVRFHFGMWDGRRVERWGGIQLLGEWSIFTEPEPRMAGVRWMHRFNLTDSVMRVYHFRLGGRGN